MLPKWHILIGFVFSYILVYFFNVSTISGFIIFISSFLIIDLDHYFLYILTKKDFNFIRFYNSSLDEHKKYLNLSEEERRAYKKKLFIFHGVEFWMVLIILAFFNDVFLLVLAGFVIHIIADWIEMYFIHEPFYIKFSQIYTYIKNKKKSLSKQVNNSFNQI